MSKIVQAINSMISHPELIEQVLQGENEIFFLYKKKYKWSMRENNKGEYYLYYYPSSIDLEVLSNFNADDWQDFSQMVIYKDADLGTKEAKASFCELYSLIREKVFGVDKVLDDIIGEDF